MARPWRLLVPVALAASAPTAYAAPAPKRPAHPAAKPTAAVRNESAKYGVYMLNSRIGSMTTKTYPAQFEGKQAVRMDATTSIKVTALGGTVEQDMSMSEWLDLQGRPLLSKTVMTSQGRTTQIDTRYYPTKVVCNLDAGGQKSNKVIPIPAGVKLSSDPEMSSSAGSVPKVGSKETLYFFEPVMMTIQKVELQVVKAEKRSVGGKQVLAYLVKTKNSFTGGSETWVDAKGGLLEDKNPLGLRMVREDVDADKNAAAYEPPKDFAVATSIKTAVKLPDARTTQFLKLKVSGIPDDSLILSDTRQRVASREQSGERWTATYEIQARELPQQSLPLAAPTTTGDGLGDAPYLGITDPSIRKVAKELADGAPDRAAVARRVRAWVKGHMEQPTNIGTPRSAAEIMRNKDGVCRDYATLYAAIARAAGVPTRLCSGIVFFQDGFFYHAWVETQLTAGADGWYAFDPTLSDDFVDATHVKFAQGDPLQMYGAVRVVGQIQGEILEHR